MIGFGANAGGMTSALLGGTVNGVKHEVTVSVGSVYRLSTDDCLFRCR